MKPIKICSIPECGKPLKGRGLCDMHIQRLRKHGDPLYVRIRATGCSVPECKNPPHARGLCGTHYYHLLKGRTEMKPIREQGLSVDQRFWEKVDKTDTCWVWVGSKSSAGYGCIRGASGLIVAHRFSYELVNGAIAAGLEIDHLCFNRACVNPEHLRTATRKQNEEHQRGARADSKSGVRGVTWHCGKWRATVGHNGSQIYAGRFTSLREAESAVIAKRLELFTHNDIDRVSA